MAINVVAYENILPISFANCFRTLEKKHLHEHELQLSDYDIKKYFEPNIMYFWYYLQLYNLTLKTSQAKIENIYFSTRNLYILGENTSKYCSQIILVHVHAIVFF